MLRALQRIRISPDSAHHRRKPNKRRSDLSPQSEPAGRTSLGRASRADRAHRRRTLGEGPCEGRGGGRGAGEPRTRGHYRSKTHLSAAGPPAPVLGDRRHTLRKKLRLYCMPKILHRVLGDRRRELGDEATRWLTDSGSSPNGRSTPAGEGTNSTAPHLPLLDWRRQCVRPSE